MIKKRNLTLIFVLVLTMALLPNLADTALMVETDAVTADCYFIGWRFIS